MQTGRGNYWLGQRVLMRVLVFWDKRHSQPISVSFVRVVVVLFFHCDDNVSMLDFFFS